MFCRAFTGRSIARGLVLLRKFSTVGLFQNLTQLDPLFSTTSVALFLNPDFSVRPSGADHQWVQVPPR